MRRGRTDQIWRINCTECRDKVPDLDLDLTRLTHDVRGHDPNNIQWGTRSTILAFCFRQKCRNRLMVFYLYGGPSEKKILSETCRTKIFMSFFDETDENVAFEHGHLSHVRDKSVSSRQVGPVLMPFATSTSP